MSDERQLLNARIAELLHKALVRIRALSYALPPDEPDRREEMNDLADLLHNLPRYIVGHDEFAIDSLEQLREGVVEHVRRFYPNIDPATHQYVQLLDMDAEIFLHHYAESRWGEPAPSSTAKE